MICIIVSRSRDFSQNFQEIFFQLLEQRIFFQIYRIYVKSRVPRTIEDEVIFTKRKKMENSKYDNIRRENSIFLEN